MIPRNSLHEREAFFDADKKPEVYKFSLIRTEETESIEPWKDSHDYDLLRINAQTKKSLTKAQPTLFKSRRDILAQIVSKKKLRSVKQNKSINSIHPKQIHLVQSKDQYRSRHRIHDQPSIVSCFTSTPTNASSYAKILLLNCQDLSSKLGNALKINITPKRLHKGIVRRSIDSIGQTITLDTRNSNRTAHQNNCSPQNNPGYNIEKPIKLHHNQSVAQMKKVLLHADPKIYSPGYMKLLQDEIILSRRRIA